MTGLREEKKARTRAAIAAAAAELFGRDGYLGVTMAQVATAAGVADQTLYNYFPTKESLVFDRAGELERQLLTALSGRAAGVSVPDAFGTWLATVSQGEDARRAVTSSGGMPRLVAAVEPLHRALLGLTHQMATALAAWLAEAEAMPEPAAVAAADALLAVFTRAVEQLGATPSEAELPALAAWSAAALDSLRPLFGSA